ncbi:phage portal protein [Saccharopolyspora sp. NPDC000359]|uniref:phage portal protein n=1 Tax=Saccharopolyspora sp. NPDC000359 TaxID=3154251 RepID=UPI00331A0ECC
MVVFSSGGALAGTTFSSLSVPWQVDGTVIVPDPGIPLVEAASDAPGVWRTQPSVRKVVDFIARNVASVPLHVFERRSVNDRPRVTDHPLAWLLAEPAPGVTPFRFWHGILVDFLLHDRWCAQLLPNADTNSGYELRRIPASRMRLLDDGWGRVAAVHIVDPDGQAAEHDPAGFVFDHGWGGANGVPPIETLHTILAESAEAVAYRRGVWKNGARVPMVIERPADAPAWSESSRNRFVEMWRRFTRGGGQEGGTPLLEDGMTVKEVSAFTPRDAQDIEGRRLTDAEVASAYHIAPELVGAREGTYSNIEAYRQMLYRDNLGPWLTQIEQTCNALLVPQLDRAGQLYVEANVEAKLRGSFEEQARILQASTGGPWLTRNEARARANLPALEGADELVVPLNVTEGGLASPQDTAPDEAMRES